VDTDCQNATEYWFYCAFSSENRTNIYSEISELKKLTAVYMMVCHFHAVVWMEYTRGTLFIILDRDCKTSLNVEKKHVVRAAEGQMRPMSTCGGPAFA
jgi:hypothetical protein